MYAQVPSTSCKYCIHCHVVSLANRARVGDGACRRYPSIERCTHADRSRRTAGCCVLLRAANSQITRSNHVLFRVLPFELLIRCCHKGAYWVEATLTTNERLKLFIAKGYM